MGKKIVGFNFLERHSRMEQSKDIDADHVIIDRADYEKVVSYFHSHQAESQDMLNNENCVVDAITEEHVEMWY